LPAPIIDYSTLRRRRKFSARTAATLFAVIGIPILCAWILLHGPTSGEIRLDTGDLRYCYFGIPFRYSHMPQPQRSQLLSVAAGSSILKPQWYTCVTYPLPTTNNPDAMLEGFYFRATAWISIDPRLARMIVEDIATYVKHTNAQAGLPDSFYLVSGFVVSQNSQGRWTVEPDWRQDEEVRDYFTAKGYGPPTTQPLTH
jgi:hypothetical protein